MNKKQYVRKSHKFEKKIKTIAWFKYTKLISGFKNDTLFKEHLKSLSTEFEAARQWDNYSSGLSRPKDERLKLLDKFYPGSLNVFEYGPENSKLFEVMFCDDVQEQFIEIVLTRPSPFKRVSNNAHNRFLDSDLELVLGSMDEMILDRKKLGSTCYPFYSNQLSFQHLANCTILFRYFLIRNQYNSANFQIENIISTLINYLAMTEIRILLSNYGIRETYLEWLYELLVVWCANNFSGYLISLTTELPSKEKFIEKPSAFIKFMISGYLKCSFMGDKENDEKLEDLKKAKLNSEKWLINDKYTIKDLKLSFNKNDSLETQVGLAASWACV